MCKTMGQGQDCQKTEKLINTCEYAGALGISYGGVSSSSTLYS